MVSTVRSALPTDFFQVKMVIPIQLQFNCNIVIRHCAHYHSTILLTLVADTVGISSISLWALAFQAGLYQQLHFQGHTATSKSFFYIRRPGKSLGIVSWFGFTHVAILAL